MTNGFVNSVKSKTDSLPLRAYFKNEDIGHALDTANYNSARGWLTNKQGRQIEITLDDNIELERILAEGLDFDHLHLHVEFEELESTRITITTGNVPVEAGDMLISEVIEAHGGRIERVAYVTQEYRGNQVQTGRRRYYTTKTKDFQPLPKVVRLFGGRYISFRHPGQPVTEDSWGANDIPSARDNRSYASVLTEQLPSQPDHTAYQDTEGEINQQTSPRNRYDPPQSPAPAQPTQSILPSEPAPPTKPAPPPPPPAQVQPPPPTEQSSPAQPPPPPQQTQPAMPLQPSESPAPMSNEGVHEYIQFTPEAAMDWEETTTTPIPAHIERFTISYFEWLQANIRPSDPRLQNQFINIWHSCITKVQHRNSTQQNPQYDPNPPPSTPQIEQVNPRLSLNARSMKIMQQSAATSLRSGALEATDPPFVTDSMQEGRTPTGEIQHLETELATDQHTNNSGDTDSETRQDMEWDGGALERARNRPLEAITVIDSDEGEEGTVDIGQQEEGEILSDEKLEDKPVANLTPSPPETVTELTTKDLLPDYPNQVSASQSLASGPETPHSKSKKKKKRYKPGTDSEAGVVPPGAKKPNKPDGCHIKVGNYDKRLTNDECRKLRDKIDGKQTLTHEDILLDTLLNHGRLNNMLNHQNTTSETKAKMHSYYGYLYYRHIGPMSSEWSENPYIDHTPEGVLNTWDEFTTNKTKYSHKLYEDYLPMLNLSRRSGKS